MSSWWVDKASDWKALVGDKASLGMKALVGTVLVGVVTYTFFRKRDKIPAEITSSNIQSKPEERIELKPVPIKPDW